MIWGRVAITNQTQRQVEQGYSATLLVENSVLGVEVKTVHEGEGSTTPVPNAEKWSHEAKALVPPRLSLKMNDEYLL
ncbi:MAG: hypothetical protein V7L00_28395 [Nostoc sp.]|uniref:hypothetical protein n=1 Tax=Nostoc sp. TaxID=1180 RepID=UPI002FF688FF